LKSVSYFLGEGFELVVASISFVLTNTFSDFSRSLSALTNVRRLSAEH
jgi:hypothetical protein